MSGVIFGHHTWREGRGGASSCYRWVSAATPLVQDTSLQEKNYLAPNANSAEVESPCSMQRRAFCENQLYNKSDLLESIPYEFMA